MVLVNAVGARLLDTDTNTDAFFKFCGYGTGYGACAHENSASIYFIYTSFVNIYITI